MTVGSLFKLIHIFTVMFGSPSTRVLFSVPAVAFCCVLFIWPHKLRTCPYSLLIDFSNVLGVKFRTDVSVWDETSWENIWQFYLLLSQGDTCYLLSGFRNSPLISVHIIIQFSLSLSFSKYIRLRQYYEFPFILRDLRRIYQCVLRQLREKKQELW